MNTKSLGTTGVRVPEIGIGTYRLRGEGEVIQRGIEAGATFIDTAEMYGNEALVGAAIRGRRSEVFLATKTHHHRYAEVIRCADESLQQLGVDHIDLYQLHWPNAAVPIAETMGAFAALVDAGKVRFIGLSNFSIAEFEAAQHAIPTHRLVSNQVRYSLVDRTIEADVLPWSQAQQVLVIAYSPLAQGLDRILARDRHGVIPAICRETGKTPSQVALNWCVYSPGVIAIPKAGSAAHVLENCGASGWRLSAEQKARLDREVGFEAAPRWVRGLRRWGRGIRQRVRGE